MKIDFVPFPRQLQFCFFVANTTSSICQTSTPFFSHNSKKISRIRKINSHNSQSKYITKHPFELVCSAEFFHFIWNIKVVTALGLFSKIFTKSKAGETQFLIWRHGAN